MVMSGRVPAVGVARRILCVGEDRTLLETRRSILESERYIVLTLTARQLPKLDPLPPITLAIVCHSVQGSARGQAINWLQRRLSRTRILLPDRTGGRLRSTHGPTSFIHPATGDAEIRCRPDRADTPGRHYADQSQFLGRSIEKPKPCSSSSYPSQPIIRSGAGQQVPPVLYAGVVFRQAAGNA